MSVFLGNLILPLVPRTARREPRQRGPETVLIHGWSADRRVLRHFHSQKAYSCIHESPRVSTLGLCRDLPRPRYYDSIGSDPPSFVDSRTNELSTRGAKWISDNKKIFVFSAGARRRRRRVSGGFATTIAQRLGFLASRNSRARGLSILGNRGRTSAQTQRFVIRAPSGVEDCAYRRLAGAAGSAVFQAFQEFGRAVEAPRSRQFTGTNGVVISS